MDAAFLEVVQEAYLARRQRGVHISSHDLEWIARWYRTGAPASVIVEGIRRAFDSAPRRVSNLAYAREAVEEEILRWQKLNVGRSHAPSTPRPPDSVPLEALLRVLAAPPTPRVSQIFAGAAALVQALQARIISGEELDPIGALCALGDEISDRVLGRLPEAERLALERDVDARLAPERPLVRPEDFARTRRAFLRKAVRTHLQIPEFIDYGDI
ncbi:hypothetical protein KKF91_13265 [Myxococcota bacterium]|nr:hypothetical protein [Myxococcota bacterium]MBU1431506.1 hypothetical protein [Myxococcota bacterium]MBU1898159.1 hypothetical protein [Myxococcota bacterium]